MKPSRLRCAFGSTPASMRRTVEKAVRNPAPPPERAHGYPAEANDPPAQPSRARFFALLIPAALLLALTALLAFSSGRLPLPERDGQRWLEVMISGTIGSSINAVLSGRDGRQQTDAP